MEMCVCVYLLLFTSKCLMRRRRIMRTSQKSHQGLGLKGCLSSPWRRRSHPSQQEAPSSSSVAPTRESPEHGRTVTGAAPHLLTDSPLALFQLPRVLPQADQPPDLHQPHLGLHHAELRVPGCRGPHTQLLGPQHRTWTLCVFAPAVGLGTGVRLSLSDDANILEWLDDLNLCIASCRYLVILTMLSPQSLLLRSCWR